MKRIIAFILLLSVLVSSLSSCTPARDTETVISSGITLTSSDTEKFGIMLTERLGELSQNVVLGIGDSADYGVDMSDFEDDGYIIKNLGEDTVIFGKTADGLDRACRRFANDIELDGVSADTVYHEGYRIDELRLFGTPISQFTVESPSFQVDNTMLAVSELVRLTEKACGVLLPVAEEDSVTDHVISFRFNSNPALGSVGYRYFEENGNLIFEVAQDYGSLNAVYGFLEEECGWDGLVLGDSMLAESTLIDIPAGIDKTVVPAFDYLDSGIEFDTDRDTSSISQMSIGPIPAAKHGMAIHDFGGLGDNPDNRQICYTDEEVYQTVLSSVYNYINTTGGLREIDISQWDGAEYCLCESCEAVLQEEGSAAGAVIRFANRLSSELSTDHPGIAYKILADSDTNVPPKTAPNDNVYVTFCIDGYCLNHSQSDGDNELECRYLKDWLELSNNVYVSICTEDSPLQQYTVIDGIYDSISYLYDVGIKGIYLEAPAYGLGIQRIEHQLISYLNRNIEATPEEFESQLCRLLEKEYGDGWSYVREYLTLLDTVQDAVGCYNCGTDFPAAHSGNRYDTAVFADYFDSMALLLERAVTLASSEEQQAALELLSCHMYYEGCYSSYFETYYSGDRDRISVLDDRYSLMIDRLVKNGFDLTALSVHDNLYDTAWRSWIEWQDELYSGEIPEYSDTDQLMEFCDSVNENTADDRLTFAFQSDTHYLSSATDEKKDSYRKLVESRMRMNRYVDLDFIAHGGDIINGDQATKELALQSLSEVTSIINGTHMPITSIFLRGNHDDNSWYGYAQSGQKWYDVFPTDTVLTSDDWRDYIFADQSDKIVTDDTGTYGYFDHEESKIRVLLLDTSDVPYIESEEGIYKYGAYAGHGIRQDQLQFMADAMTFSDKGDDAPNWAILVLSHVPVETLKMPTSKYRFGGLEASGRNFYAFLRILKAYQCGTVFNEKQSKPTNYGDGGYEANDKWNDGPNDFTYNVYADFSANGPGEVIGIVSGHTHVDNFSDEVGMVSYSGNGKIYPKLSWGYPYFSVGSYGLTVFTVDRNGDDTGTIYVNHLGTSTVPRADMISEGDNAVATKDTTASGVVSSTPDSGTIASGKYTVNYSQNR